MSGVGFSSPLLIIFKELKLAKLKTFSGVKSHSNTYTGNSGSVGYSQNRGTSGSQPAFGGGFNPSASNPFGMGTGHQGQSTHDRVQFNYRGAMRSTGRVFTFKGVQSRTFNYNGMVTKAPVSVIGR